MDDLSGRAGSDLAAQEEAYHALCAYTLAHARGDPSFIHQHVVDTYAAQQASVRSKPITVAFSLIGLYLHVERGCTGKEVQRVHMLLARRKRSWPSFPLPHDRGRTTTLDVLAAPEGPQRDAAIEAWCRSVWAAFAESRPIVVHLLKEHA